MSNLAMMMGLGSGAGGVAVADVFSTTLYTGTSAEQTITNGIDLAGNGGLVWTKGRNNSNYHYLIDTERGAGKFLFSNDTSAQAENIASISSFNSDGYVLGNLGGLNGSPDNYVSWTFRKAPKFFDVVTYTGDGVAGREIAHNLGTTVGTLIVKCTSAAKSWFVWHRGLSNSGNSWISLNGTSAEASSTSLWNSTIPSDSVFTLGSNVNTNESGQTYVAYLFAHNEDLIQCGSFSGNDATVNVDLGWQPQFIIAKGSNASGNWHMYDNERGAGAYILADSSNQEFTDSSPDIVFNSTGFDASGNFGISGRDYIYIAIKAED